MKGGKYNMKKKMKKIKVGGNVAKNLANPWLIHLKKMRAKHPKKSYKELMILSKKNYKPIR